MCYILVSAASNHVHGRTRDANAPIGRGRRTKHSCSDRNRTLLLLKKYYDRRYSRFGHGRHLGSTRSTGQFGPVVILHD